MFHLVQLSTFIKKLSTAPQMRRPSQLWWGKKSSNNGSKALPIETSISCPKFYPESKNHLPACIRLRPLATLYLLSPHLQAKPLQVSIPSWQSLILKPGHLRATGQCLLPASFHNS